MVQLLNLFALCLVLTSCVLAQLDFVLDNDAMVLADDTVLADVPVVYVEKDDDQKPGMGGDEPKKDEPKDDDQTKDGDQPAMGGDDQKKDDQKKDGDQPAMGGDDQKKDDQKKDDQKKDDGTIRIRNPFVTGAAPKHTVGGMVLTLMVLSAASLYL